MEDYEEIIEDLSNSFDEISGFINIISILKEYESFIEWLQEYHNIHSPEDYFHGFSYFFEVCYRSLIGHIINNISMELDEDVTFKRATFEGVNIEDIPQSCEKAVFTKNLWEKFKPIKKAKNWNQFDKALNSIEGVVILFNEIIDRYTLLETSSELKKDEVKKILSIIQLHSYFHDFSSVKQPYGYTMGTILKDNYTSKRLDDVYPGFVYALQYVWYQLLDHKKFKNSCLRNLNKIHIKNKGEAEQKLKREKSDLGIPLTENEFKKHLIQTDPKYKSEYNILNSLSEEEISDRKEQLKNSLNNLKKWFALDTIYGEISENIVRPLEKKHDFSYPLSSNIALAEEFDKKILKKYLVKKEKNNPKYLSNEDDEKLKRKKLDYYLLWDEVQVLDTQKSLDFNGVHTFCYLLKGIIKEKQFRDVEGKIPVRIFKHPAQKIKGEIGYDYSYGVHISSFDGLSSDSGWIIFFNCATDYSGHGGDLYTKAETVIRDCKGSEEIEVKELDVNIELFKDMLKSRTVNSVFDIIKYQTGIGDYIDVNITELKEESKELIGNAKGKLLEYVFYNWFVENEAERFNITNAEKNIKCDKEVDDEQIDFFIIHNDKIDIFECKVKLHKSDFKEKDNIFQQLKQKKEALEEKYTDKKINKKILLYEKTSKEWKEQIEKSTVSLDYYPFKESLRECKDKEVNKLDKIFLKDISHIPEF